MRSSSYKKPSSSQSWFEEGFIAVVGPGQHAPFSGRVSRDPYRLIYSGHPSKGLEAALGVVRLLRAQNPRFELHIYGGNRLWGEKETDFPPEAGVFYHGLLGQNRLAQELQRSSFSLHLQAIQEGFGLGLIEALAAGCIVLASPVGAIVELVRSGTNGFLIPGDHLASDTWERATELILQLVRAADFAEYIRQQARNLPWTWERMARVWTQHWDWILEQKGELTRNDAGSCACPECGAAWLLMADGYHCTGCGLYSGSPEPFQLSRNGKG
jgi:glycosyltransferase involved in cell wall biosynthesis